ncbi:MAG: molybdopterin guanine dinucleotide synthesis [Pseudomonadota bacterium]
MSPFDTVVIIDWSAGNDTGATPRKDAIWAGLVRSGVEDAPVYLRNREVALEWIRGLIDTELRSGRRLFAGFDFPFGYPSGFADHVVGRPDTLALWDFFASELVDTPKANDRFDLAGALNRRFPGVGPFWFNGLSRDIADLPRKKSERTDSHGLPERRQTEIAAVGSFTAWQMGGAGAVGGQVMTGMAALSKLRVEFPGEIAVWPFEPPHAPIVLGEIYPSLIADPVRAAGDPIKDRAQVRLLARALARLTPGQWVELLSKDAPEEGWILGAGKADGLIAALGP